MGSKGRAGTGGNWKSIRCGIKFRSNILEDDLKFISWVKILVTLREDIPVQSQMNRQKMKRNISNGRFWNQSSGEPNKRSKTKVRECLQKSKRMRKCEDLRN